MNVIASERKSERGREIDGNDVISKSIKLQRQKCLSVLELLPGNEQLYFQNRSRQKMNK